jgi:adenylate cyclase class 2
MSTLEIEVKFFLADVEAARQRLQQTGARSQGRFFEYNVCFENEAGDLHRGKSLLRLRKDSETTLTYKAAPADRDDEFKVLRELEVFVSDFDTMADILMSLGYHRAQVYEKYRETFTLGSSHICLDSMPFGNFLEIEGEKEDIRRLARQLGMPWHRRILCNYRSMFFTIKERLNLGFDDITFDDFREVALEINTFLPLFEAG